MPEIQTQNRLNSAPVSVELARFGNFSAYKPKVGDVIIWHGWFNHWFGIVTGMEKTDLVVLVEKLPKLLILMPEEERLVKTKRVPLMKLRKSIAGEYAVLQDGVWFIDN